MDNIDGLITKDNIYRLLSDYRAYIPNDIRHAMCERVKEFPSVDITQNWISITDRLPEIKENYVSDYVLCYVPDYEHPYIFDRYEVNMFGQICFSIEKQFDVTVTHWMPLPEPPEEV